MVNFKDFYSTICNTKQQMPLARYTLAAEMPFREPKIARPDIIWGLATKSTVIRDNLATERSCFGRKPRTPLRAVP
jgi:hypothetical protein